MMETPSPFNDLLAFGKLRIRVVNGPSAGSTALLPQNSCRIGSGLQDDLVLLAYDLFEGHAELSAGLMPFSPLRVKALTGSVAVSGGQEIDPGQYLDIATPANIMLGGCELLIERPAATGVYLRWAAAMAAVVLLAVGLWAMLPKSLPSAASVRVPDAVAQAEPALAQVNDAPEKVVAAKLNELGLATQIIVKPSADGSVALSGLFSTRTANAWREFLQWYDSQPDFPPLLNSVSRADESDDLPRIASVWAQEPAQLVMEDGRVVREGEQLDVYWKFEGLTASGVEISRNGTKVIIDF
jgi:hypothetical protein